MEIYKNKIEFSVDFHHYLKLMEKANYVVEKIFEYRRSIGDCKVPYLHDGNFNIIEITENDIIIDMEDGYYSIRTIIPTSYLYIEDFIMQYKKDAI